MADTLTDAEIAAIAAFPESRIQRIPRGTSGEATYVWDYNRNRSSNDNLRVARKARTRTKLDVARDVRIAKVRRQREQRMREVASMHERGMTRLEIARLLGVSDETVRMDLVRLQERNP